MRNSCKLNKKLSSLKRNTSVVDNGSVMHVECHDSAHILEGSAKITCVNGTWTPGIPRCIEEPVRVDLIIGVPIGIVLFCMTLISVAICILQRKKWSTNNDKEDLIDDDQSEKGRRQFYVCDITRRQKIGVMAKDIVSLKQEAAISLKFQAHYVYLHLVLDKNGTEILSENQLDDVTEDTIMVLQAGESWYPPGNAYDYIENRRKFDVHNADRSKKITLWADSLSKLLEQGKEHFGYQAVSAVSEWEGTTITSDAALLKSQSEIMLLGNMHTWRPKSDIFVPVADYHDNYGLQKNRQEKKRIFEVMSADGRKHRSVMAKDLAELHLNAAKAHGLSNPVELAVMSSQLLISSDRDLDFYEREVLVIRKPAKMDSFERDSIDTNAVLGSNHGSAYPKRDYDHFPHERIEQKLPSMQIPPYDENTDDKKYGIHDSPYMYKPKLPSNQVNGIHERHPIGLSVTGMSKKPYAHSYSHVGDANYEMYPRYTGYEKMNKFMKDDHDSKNQQGQVGYNYADDYTSNNGNKRQGLFKLFGRSKDDSSSLDREYVQNHTDLFPKRPMIITGEPQFRSSDVLF